MKGEYHGSKRQQRGNVDGHPQTGSALEVLQGRPGKRMALRQGYRPWKGLQVSGVLEL